MKATVETRVIEGLDVAFHKSNLRTPGVRCTRLNSGPVWGRAVAIDDKHVEYGISYEPHFRVEDLPHLAAVVSGLMLVAVELEATS